MKETEVIENVVKEEEMETDEQEASTLTSAKQADEEVDLSYLVEDESPEEAAVEDGKTNDTLVDNAAEQARGAQPTGYTLATTQVGSFKSFVNYFT